MIIKSLAIKNFRNHSFLSYDFNPGLNVITGPNASGKTNVVEAIYYLSLARSFRTKDNEGLIQNNKEQAQIHAIIVEGDIKRDIRVVLLKNNRLVFINEKPIKKLSELSKVTNVVLFEPKDVMLFRGSPKNRRNFLDISIFKKTPSYLEHISRYEKILKERNDILKQEKIDPLLLETNTELLVDVSHSIVEYREKYVKDINDILNKITRALTGEDSQFKVHYYPFVKNNENFKQSALSAYQNAKEVDIRKKSTSIGVHHEDFFVTLNGKEIGEYGSQGENRLAALALKLSSYFLIEDKTKRPIVVLDDVMSELDQKHRLRLIAFLKKFEQVFITATRLEIAGASQYYIKNKEVF